MQELVLEQAKKIVSELNDSRTLELFNEQAIGKMVRAKLILEIGGEKALKLAAIVELIHLASLLHDDVIDHSNTRRGKATTNSIYGEHTAVMLGDILYSKAFASLVEYGPEVASAIALAVSRLSVGELVDVALGECFNEDEQVYTKMIYDKTASLIEACCYASAHIAGYNTNAFAIYGKSLGLAFQLIDDLLDIFADEQTLGKPALSDFKEGKTTIAYMRLYKKLDENGKQKLKSLFKKEPTNEEKLWIFDMFNKHNIKEICEQEAANIMIDGLKAIQDSNIPQTLKNRLIEIATKLLGRTF